MLHGARATTHTHGPLAWVIGTVPPVVAVVREPPDLKGEGEGGLVVLMSDAPHDPWELQHTDPGLTRWCVHCIIDAHPDCGRGLDLALEHGGACRDKDGTWHPGLTPPRRRPGRRQRAGRRRRRLLRRITAGRTIEP
jgi:hypothetical protein